MHRASTGDDARHFLTQAANCGLRLVPLCPADHKGVTANHAASCTTPGSRPRLANWVTHASDNPETIGKWLDKWPEGNLGLLTGARGRVVALQIRGEFGLGKLAKWFPDGQPLTWHYLTDQTACYLFRVPSSHLLDPYAEFDPADASQGVHIFADNEAAPIPPSVDEHGNRYAWAPLQGPSDIPLAHAPAVLLALLSPPANEATATDVSQTGYADPGSDPAPSESEGSDHMDIELPSHSRRLLQGSEYGIDGGFLAVKSFDSKRNPYWDPLCNFLAWIHCDVAKDDGAQRHRLYEMRGIMIKSGESLPLLTIPAEEFETMKWLSMWGPRPNLRPGRLVRDMVRHAIQTTAWAASKRTIFAHLGWVRLDGRWVYLHAGGAIGELGVSVELDPRLQGYTLSATDDETQSMRASLRLLDVAPLHVTLVLWAATYLAPLCECLRWSNIEPKFLLWLHGYTGTRKTTLAKLFSCHFGDLLERPPTNFNDTANSIEKRAFDAKDSLLLVDDYHPVSSPRESKAMAQLAERLLRGYGDRVGRGRMRQDATLRSDYLPRGMAIVTAEDVLDTGSSVARLFPVELKPGDVNIAALTEAQRDAHSLSGAMSGYVAWLAQKMSSPDDGRLAAMFQERRRQAHDANLHGRLVEAAAWLHIGLSYGLEYAVSVGSLDEDRRESLLETAWELFSTTALAQGNSIQQVRATTRFLEIVAELLASGIIHTMPVDLQGDADPVRFPGTRVGWSDSQYYYFLPDVLFNSVERFLSAENSHFPVTRQTLFKQLAQEGLIVTETGTESGRARTHTLRKKEIGGDRTRKLWVKREALDGGPMPPGRERGRGQSRQPMAPNCSLFDDSPCEDDP